jgi:hypothetical protein
MAEWSLRPCSRKLCMYLHVTAFKERDPKQTEIFFRAQARLSSAAWAAINCFTCSRSSAVFKLNCTPIPKPGCTTCTVPRTRNFMSRVRTTMSNPVREGKGEGVST